jgi:hypothetical protein
MSSCIVQTSSAGSQMCMINQANKLLLIFRTCGRSPSVTGNIISYRKAVQKRRICLGNSFLLTATHLLFPAVCLRSDEITRTKLTPVRICLNVHRTCTHNLWRQKHQDTVTTRLMKACRKCIRWLQATTVPPVYAVAYSPSPRSLNHQKLTCIPCTYVVVPTYKKQSTINQLAGRRHILMTRLKEPLAKPSLLQLIASK